MPDLFAKVITLMGWNSSYRYKLLGKLIRSDNELLFVFDLTTPEIYVRTAKDDGKIKTSRTPTYPAEWQNQFGVPVEEHQSNLQINMFDGYAVFGISENRPSEEPENPTKPQKEETHYEQSSSSQPILCIDLKKNRIRIHKLTLHMLGDPEYIQLLVNPDSHMIAVKKVSVRITLPTMSGHVIPISETVTNYTAVNCSRH